jgi:Na+-transporting NADH:ubiquinone oxidoreductase subunit NqrF
VLHVESHKFLLFVSSWVIIVVATIAIVASTVAGGCVCWFCRRELALSQEGASVMPTNRTGKQVSNLAPFSFSRYHFLSWSCQVEKKNSAAAQLQQQRSELQRHHCCSIASDNVVIIATLVRPTSVRFSSDDSFKPCRPARLSSYVFVILRYVVLRTVLPSCLFIQHLFDFHLTFVQRSFDLRAS